MPAKSPEKKKLIDRGHDVDNMQSAINSCNIDAVARAVRTVLETGAWREYWLGMKVNSFDTFPAFLTHHPAKVYGSKGTRPTENGYWNPEYVKALLVKSGDEGVLELFNKAMLGERYRLLDEKDKANQRPIGANQHGKGLYTTESGIKALKYPNGTSAAAALRRLRKHRPDIHRRVLAGELTANAGMVEAGFRKMKPKKRLTVLERFQRLWAKLDTADRVEFLRWAKSHKE